MQSAAARCKSLCLHLCLLVCVQIGAASPPKVSLLGIDQLIKQTNNTELDKYNQVHEQEWFTMCAYVFAISSNIWNCAAQSSPHAASLGPLPLEPGADRHRWRSDGLALRFIIKDFRVWLDDLIVLEERNSDLEVVDAYDIVC